MQTKAKHLYLYSVLTLGVYFLTWCSRSRNKIHRAAHTQPIPSPWLLVIPTANFWWIWRYAEALEYVSFKRIKASSTFSFFLVGYFVPAYLFYSFFNLFYSGSAYADVFHEHPLMFLPFVAAAFLLLQSIGLGFFISHIQKDIDRARQQSKSRH